MTQVATTERIDWGQFEALKKVRVSEVLVYLRSVSKKTKLKKSISSPGISKSKAPWQIAAEVNKRKMEQLEANTSEV